jgi:hypothetical protein
MKTASHTPLAVILAVSADQMTLCAEKLADFLASFRIQPVIPSMTGCQCGKDAVNPWVIAHQTVRPPSMSVRQLS